MPEIVGEERKKILKAYGAGFVMTPKEKGIEEILLEARRIVK